MSMGSTRGAFFAHTKNEGFSKPLELTVRPACQVVFRLEPSASRRRRRALLASELDVLS